MCVLRLHREETRLMREQRCSKAAAAAALMRPAELMERPQHQYVQDQWTSSGGGGRRGRTRWEKEQE